MTQIDIKTLVDEINSKNNKEFIIEFEGIITAKIKIKNLKITEDENNINIFEKDIEQEKIKFGVRIDIWTHFMRGCIIELCTLH